MVSLIYVYFGLTKITKLIPDLKNYYKAFYLADIGYYFFRASSILLAVLAIYFAYEGVHELSEGIQQLI